MNSDRQQTKNGIVRSAKGFAVLSLLALSLAACDGANQGVQIGTGSSADPVVVDFPIAYVKAPVPVDDNGVFQQQDVREQITFDFGADLYYRARAAVGAEAINITGEVTQGLGAIRDVEMAYDGSAVLFSMRTPFDPDADEEDLPTWNLWEYTFETGELRRLIPSDLTAEIGHDIMPKYLPDGRIVFASTRQTRSQAILLDEGKAGFPAMDEDENEYAFNIHIMNGDGGNIDQLTYNQSHDLDPAVLTDGRIVFSRWDHAAQNDEVNLYRMYPDGTGLELLYGAQSHDTGTNGEEVQFLQPREAEDGRMLALLQPFTNTEGGGQVVIIDTPQYVEITQPTKDNIGILTGPAQEDATVNEVVTQQGAPSPGGRYASAYPISDGTGRMLVSWSQCRLTEILPDDGDANTIDERIVACTDDNLANVIINDDPDNVITPVAGDFVVAPPLYGIWIYDPRDDTQLPIVPGEEGFMFTEVVTADPRVAPAALPDGMNDFVLDGTLAAAGEAVINIRSVYDFDGTALVDINAMADPAITPADDRVARFLRIEKAVSIPEEDLLDIDDTAFGLNRNDGMKEIVGYVEIAPDGSVMAKVPANTALYVSVVDAKGQRITPRHNNWIAARPGEELKCQGCHVADSGVSHGRKDAFDTAWAGAPVAGVEFPNTDPQWFAGNAGETMAEILVRATCSDGDCPPIQPSLNIEYTDIWTDPTDLTLTPGTDIDLSFKDLTTASPASVACQDNWQSQCRTIINYETNIHPLWNDPRLVVDDMGNPVLDPVTGLQLSNNCLQCHTPVDPADNMPRVPAGQLELQDGQSPDEADHFHAYRELLVTDNLQELQNGALVDVLVQNGVDADGNPILETVPIGSPASNDGALASSDFFSRFEDPNDLHFEILSPAELRLIAEWLDVGAQYYNNPFDAPIN